MFAVNLRLTTIAMITAAGPTQCYSCLENDSATCSANQQVQTCATDRGSLGTTHCFSGAGIYRDKLGNTNYGVMRGCINCADKRQACARTFGYLKASRRWTLLQCEIECCTGDECNTGTFPTLPTPGSVLPTPAGPTQCYSCLENDPATCSANQRMQTCATDPSSLGTTHCGSGTGIYHDESGNTKHGFFRGCINCADKAQACGRVYGYVRALLGWTVQQCEIECCTGDKCNTEAFPTVPTPGSGGSKNTQEHVTGVLAFAATSVIIWHHF